MLGGSCHPCCPQPQNWYCYDFRACGCYTNDLRPSVVNMQGGPEPRYMRVLWEFQITQPSYGRFISLSNGLPYLTKYDQNSFNRSFQTYGYTYPGDANWPGPRPILYLGYAGGFDPTCLNTQEHCAYSWTGVDGSQPIGGSNNPRPQAFFDWQGGFIMDFYQYLSIMMSCVRTGFTADADMNYVVDPFVSAAATPAEANASPPRGELRWTDTLFVEGPQGIFASPISIKGQTKNFSSDVQTLIGVPGFTFEQAFPIITRWPPQPDISAATITRVDEGVISQFRCFYWDYQITYPLKKWSLLPNDITQAELLTVGTLRLRFADTFVGGF